MQISFISESWSYGTEPQYEAPAKEKIPGGGIAGLCRWNIMAMLSACSLTGKCHPPCFWGVPGETLSFLFTFANPSFEDFQGGQLFSLIP